MADTAKKNPITPVLVPDFDADRVRDLNEQMLTAAKQAGNASLDVYEKTLTGLVDFQTKVADASGLEWVSSIAKAQASFVSEIGTAYTKAVREVLK